MPIQSVYPETNVHVDAWNRQVVGRNVDASRPSIQIMWSTCTIPDDMSHFTPNHFLPLHPMTTATQFQPLPSLHAQCTSPREQRTAAKRRRGNTSSTQDDNTEERTDAVSDIDDEPASCVVTSDILSDSVAEPDHSVDAASSDDNAEEQSVNFHIVTGASQRGKDLLVSSDGYSYTVKVFIRDIVSIHYG